MLNTASLAFLNLAWTWWEDVRRTCKSRRPIVSALLRNARPIHVEWSDAEALPVLVISADWQFHVDKLSQPAERECIEWALALVVGHPCCVRIVLAGVVYPKEPTPEPTLEPPARSGKRRRHLRIVR